MKRMSSVIGRREFLRTMASAGGAFACSSVATPFTLAQTPAIAERDVKRVLAVFKCHFDAGFVATQEKVVERYFTQWFPDAIRVAKESREPGKQRYVWTTGSWLLYEYLENASNADRKRMEEAIAAGDIAWHALPFSWQTELLDQSQVRGSISLCRSLDERFGKRTTGAKMTDVPGHTRGIIAPLAAEGVTFLDIGVNSASRPAELPPFFVWKDAAGAELIVMYHHGYGEVLQVPGSDLAVAIVVRNDNSGPHKPQEIPKIYAQLKQRFPNAEITATNLTEVAHAVEPYRAAMPVVTHEMGDTWIYGVPSDPLKVARYREVTRLRTAWIARGEFKTGDATDLRLLRQLLLEPEHTWGTDTKTWLDFDHYTPDDLQSMLHAKNYEVVQFSWDEKRKDLFSGLATLPPKLRKEAEAAVSNLTPAEPRLPGGKAHPAANEIDTHHFVLRLDPRTGAIQRLRNKHSGREWASAEHPIALLCYQTLSKEDYEQFFAKYIIREADWVTKDFGKPNIERFGAISRTWYPSLSSLRVQHSSTSTKVLVELQIKDEETLRAGYASFPGKFCVEMFLPREEPRIDLHVSWFGKRATRFPESIWLSFDPVVSSQRSWMMDKCGEQVSPFDVAPAGGRQMHAVGLGFRCAEGNESFAVETLDAPVIAVGERSPLNFSRVQPSLEHGVHCNLFNNAWGTNYIQWFGEDMRFRFVLRA